MVGSLEDFDRPMPGCTCEDYDWGPNLCRLHGQASPRQQAYERDTDRRWNALRSSEKRKKGTRKAMSKPKLRMVCKDKETKESTELGAAWPSNFSDDVLNGKLGGQNAQGEAVVVKLTYQVGDGPETEVTLGKDGSHFLNFYIDDEASFA